MRESPSLKSVLDVKLSSGEGAGMRDNGLSCDSRAYENSVVTDLCGGSYCRSARYEHTILLSLSTPGITGI